MAATHPALEPAAPACEWPALTLGGVACKNCSKKTPGVFCHKHKVVAADAPPDLSRVTSKSFDIRVRFRVLRQEEKKADDDLICPITSRLMTDPVCAADGFSYERAALVEHLKHTKMSPKTKEPMAAEFCENRNLKAVIETFKAESCAATLRGKAPRAKRRVCCQDARFEPVSMVLQVMSREQASEAGLPH